MGEALDLLILPLARTAGQEQSSVMGLHVAATPRKAARLRKRDQLILHLYLDGNAPLPPDQVDKLQANLARTFFNSPGTVTAALQTVAEELNQYLLDRNIRNSSTGRQAVGYLTQIVMRNKRLSIAQSGLSHAFLLTAASVEHVHDIKLAGNGLGLSRTAQIRFTQHDMQINDAVVISIQSPASWTIEALESFQDQGPEGLRRKLLSRSGSDLDGFLVQAQSGTGELRLLRPVKVPKPIPTPQPASGMHPEPQDEQTPVTHADQPAAVPPPIPVVEPGSDFESLDAALPVEETAQAGAVSQAAAGEQAPAEQAVGDGSRGSSIGKRIADSFIRGYLGLVAFLRSILPDADIFTLPPSTMAFTAILVPLVIITVAAVVYFQRGREAQYDLHFTAAQESAQVAETKTDPSEQRLSWEATLLHLNNAEIYMRTDESRALRINAQEKVDTLNFTERLEFRPAILDPLEETAEIIRIVAREDGLYLLNRSDGVVSRAILTDEGYRLDTTFQCGPGPYGGFIVGSLVDIESMPAGSDLNASIIAIDADGNLLQCIPGTLPVAAPLEPPDINWGSPRAIAIDGNDLYILDPQTNAVWIYRGMDVSQSPRLFFDQQIPPLGDAVDLIVNQNDLFVLHADGHLTSCVYGALATSPTRCKNPEIYTDPRPGRQSGPFIEDAFFSQIEFSPPPEPSIYMLEPNSQAIYRFSVRLTLDRQFRPAETLAELPTSAFTVNRNNHAIFMAAGNQIYFAPLP